MDETKIFFLLLFSTTIFGLCVVREIYKLWNKDPARPPPRTALLMFAWFCGIVAIESPWSVAIGMIVTVLAAFITERECSFWWKQERAAQKKELLFVRQKPLPGLPTMQELTKPVPEKKKSTKMPREKITSLEDFHSKRGAARLGEVPQGKEKTKKD